MAGTTLTRRVFHHPETVITDPNSGDYLMAQGTTDLQFCKDVMEKDIFAKAGWKQYSKKKFPFLIDSAIFVKHVDNDGNMFPLSLPADFLSGKKTFRECL